MVTGAVTNIQDFGAVGDGVTNNLSTIQAAFAASDFIYVPDGDFLITGGYVGWTSRTKVKIIGPGKLRRSDVGRVLYIDSCTDVTVENLEVQGEGVTYNAQGNAIWLQDCSDFKVIGNRVRNANRMGINIEASPDGTVANNIVTDCWQDGIMVRTASNRVTVTGNVCHNNGDTVFSPPVGEGIHLFDVSDCAVVGNICYDNSDHGIALEGANYCTITGNSTSENTVCGVSINAGPVNSGVGSVVSGNTIKSNTSDGIILTAVDDCVISGNVISGNGRYGINQGIASGPSQDRIITTDNRILDNTSGGIIYDWNNVDCVVTNNVIRGSNGRGILINRAQSVDTVIAGNSIKGFPVAQITDNGTTSRIYDNDVGQKLSGSATLSSGLATITFTANMPMSSYVVALNSTVNETMYTTNKTVSGFEIRSSNGASTATVTWRIVDQKAS
jgi:parallel beta-helix repeat protein